MAKIRRDSGSKETRTRTLDKEDKAKEDKRSNLVEVGIHNKGADEDKNKDGGETHFAN